MMRPTHVVNAVDLHAGKFASNFASWASVGFIKSVVVNEVHIHPEAAAKLGRASLNGAQSQGVHGVYYQLSPAACC